MEHNEPDDAAAPAANGGTELSASSLSVWGNRSMHILSVVAEVVFALAGAWMVLASLASLPIVRDNVLLTSDGREDQLEARLREVLKELVVPVWAPDPAAIEVPCVESAVPRSDERAGGRAPGPTARVARDGASAEQEGARRPRAAPAPTTVLPSGRPRRSGSAPCTDPRLGRIMRQQQERWRVQYLRAEIALHNATTSAVQKLRRGLAIHQTPDDQQRYAVEVQEAHLRYCQAVIEVVESCHQQLVQEHGELTKRLLVGDVPASSIVAERLAEEDPSQDAAERCSESVAYPELALPENTHAQERLAFLGWLTWRLYESRSSDLIVLIGMIGCGLLGAGVSSFIRRRRESAIDRSSEFRFATLPDLASVVVRGFTAAIVVFLGVKSGLAVMASGDVDVKPYSMLFVCLLGAAFSDDTWQWASTQLGRLLRRDPGHGTDAPPTPGGADPAPGAPQGSSGQAGDAPTGTGKAAPGTA